MSDEGKSSPSAPKPRKTRAVGMSAPLAIGCLVVALFLSITSISELSGRISVRSQISIALNESQSDLNKLLIEQLQKGTAGTSIEIEDQKHRIYHLQQLILSIDALDGSSAAKEIYNVPSSDLFESRDKLRMIEPDYRSILQKYLDALGEWVGRATLADVPGSSLLALCMLSCGAIGSLTAGLR